MTYEPNMTFTWIPEGIDMMNSSGFQIAPEIIEGVATNYHYIIIEQLLGGIFFIILLWFIIWIYFKFTRTVMKK